ncbi:hypothetical protein Z043_114873 [Scleropages formosus]|uniref:RING-type domain-containing protein n=1 Tax=Scleropages formosus TaxID=113540 RepID=A0A0P7WXV3_SCLFO|nr:hypothetical protein Z043_114873 [Scleropages formosus]
MLNCVAFRAQLSSVMGVLCQAAVAEVCKLVDEGSARLRTEVRKCRTENQELHRKLRIMEMELRSARQHTLPGGASGVGTGAGGRVGRIAIGGVSRRSVSVGVQTTDPPRTVETGATRLFTLTQPGLGPQSSALMKCFSPEFLCFYPEGVGTESCAVAESCPTIEGVFGKEWCLGLWGDGDPPAVELEDTTVGHSSVVDQLPALIDSPSVKDEMFQKRKWSSDCKESLEMSGQSLDKFNDGPGEMPNHGKVATEEQPTAESAASECLEQQDIQVVTVGQKELDLQAMSVENMAEPNTHSEDSLRSAETPWGRVFRNPICSEMDAASISLLYLCAGCAVAHSWTCPCFPPGLGAPGPVHLGGGAMDRGFSPLLEEDPSCWGCDEVFSEPLVHSCLACGHCFCRSCLLQHWRPGDTWMCPACSQEPARSEEMCGDHGRRPVLFCLDDLLPICTSCQMSPEHKGHRLCPWEEAVQERKVGGQSFLG